MAKPFPVCTLWYPGDGSSDGAWGFLVSKDVCTGSYGSSSPRLLPTATLQCHFIYAFMYVFVSVQ